MQNAVSHQHPTPRHHEKEVLQQHPSPSQSVRFPAHRMSNLRKFLVNYVAPGSSIWGKFGIYVVFVMVGLGEEVMRDEMGCAAEVNGPIC